MALVVMITAGSRKYGGVKLAIEKEKKQKIISDYKEHPKDTGSASVQAAILTERINQLGEHFKTHKKDHHSAGAFGHGGKEAPAFELSEKRR